LPFAVVVGSSLKFDFGNITVVWEIKAVGQIRIIQISQVDALK